MATAKPILVIGSLNMDLVARCEHLPRTGQTVFGTGFFTAAGGKGANQAVAAARLGAHVSMAGCVGDDAFGRDLIAGLQRDGVRSEHVQAVAQPTGTALITIDAAGANTIVVMSGANTACDAVLVDRALAGESEAREAARHLLAQGARTVLITLGGEGALYHTANLALHCPAVAVQAVDTTAAGDAYIGALATALAEDRSIADSLGFAAAAAALAVTRLGAQPSLGSLAEVAAFIARHGTPTVRTV
jgi:ribokinase